MARNPFQEIERMFERMTRQLEGFDSGFGQLQLDGGMSVDVEDRADEYVVTADVPGYERDDIEVKLSGSTLTIRADHGDELETSREGEDGRYLRRERNRRTARRSVYLPDAVEEGATNANYTNGVLTVTLPKRDVGDSGTDIPIN